MVGIPGSDNRYYWANWVWQLPQRYPKSRKYVATLLLLGVFGVASVSPDLYWGEAPPAYDALRAIVVLLVGAVITSDYDLLAKAGFDQTYGWIHHTDEGLQDVIRRSYHAKRYIESGYEPIKLNYWKRGKFRAEVAESAELSEGIHFLVEVRVPSPGSSFRSPLTLCSARLERLDRTDADGKQLARLHVVNWFGQGDAVDEHERIQYREKIPKLWSGGSDIDPYITVEESEEIKQLDMDEWKNRYEGFSKIRGGLIR